MGWIHCTLCFRSTRVPQYAT